MSDYLEQYRQEQAWKIKGGSVYALEPTTDTKPCYLCGRQMGADDMDMILSTDSPPPPIRWSCKHAFDCRSQMKSRQNDLEAELAKLRRALAI